jgi:hypothetical protein
LPSKRHKNNHLFNPIGLNKRKGQYSFFAAADHNSHDLYRQNYEHTPGKLTAKADVQH